jgi:gp16 family phage-associated protein
MIDYRRDTTMDRTNTIDEVKLAFRDAGLSIARWADDNHFSRQVVYALLAGRSNGERGQAYEVAVALGVRRPPVAFGLNLPLPIRRFVEARAQEARQPHTPQA